MRAFEVFNTGIVEMSEIEKFFFFLLALFVLPVIFILTKIILRDKAVKTFINEKSNECSFQIKGYEKQSYFILHPNSICYLRIILLGFSFMFYLNNFVWIGIVLFISAAATDFLDGEIARNCNLTTPWGKFLDPLCDKILYFPYLFYFADKGLFPPYLVIVFLVCDLGVGQIGVRQLLIFSGRSAEAKIFGKIKTIVCITCVILCFVFDISLLQTIKSIISPFIKLLFYSSLVLSVLSVLEKLKKLFEIEKSAYSK